MIHYYGDYIYLTDGFNELNFCIKREYGGLDFFKHKRSYMKRQKDTFQRNVTSFRNNRTKYIFQ